MLYRISISHYVFKKWYLLWAHAVSCLLGMGFTALSSIYRLCPIDCKALRHRSSSVNHLTFHKQNLAFSSAPPVTALIELFFLSIPFCVMGKVCLKIPTSYCTSNIWGAFDLPESESGFEIMILSHRFI